MDRAAADTTIAVAAAPVHRRTGDIDWEVDASWSDLLPAGDGLPLDAWLHDGRAAPIKHGAGRTIYRVDLPERSFFVKHLRGGGIVQTLKNWLRRGACRREFEKARELARRGVPAVSPIALGERRRRARLVDSYLITKTVPEACSLDDCLTMHLAARSVVEQARLRRKLVDAAARLCAQAHDAGVFHDDLHGGNILVRLDTCQSDSSVEPQLLLVDLPGVQLSGPLDAARTCRSLAMLCAGFWRRTTESERLRFWQAYVDGRRHMPTGDAGQLARTIRRAAIEHGRRIVDGRDKRAWADNRDFLRVRTVDGSAHAVRELPRELVAEWLRDPAALWQSYVDRPVKLSFGSLMVVGELTTPVGRREIAVKRLRPKTWLKGIIGRLRRGRAPEAWYRGHALLARGIPTARPLAVYEPRNRRSCEGYLVTEWLTGSLDVHLYAWDLAKRSTAERRRRTRQTAEALGQIVGRLHDQGFTHRDLKANNLLVREKGDTLETFLIDLDGLRHGARPAAPLCAKNVARLALSAEMHPWLSQTDRLRFLRAYLRRYEPQQRRAWKWWWREIAAHVATALAELRKAGRPVT